MSPPPTRRASRSRYSSPAVAGGRATAGSRNGNGRSIGDRGQGKDKDKDKDKGDNNATSAAASVAPTRSSSTERSRRFMESWIEPERAKMPSFQEDGLLRQGVLETMEPLGTRPKPAMIKKLVSIGRDASPTPSARGGRLGGRKIVLKRKKKESTEDNGTPGSAIATSDLPSRTQSPTPSTAAATPQLGASPSSTPGPTTLLDSAPVEESVTVQHITSSVPVRKLKLLNVPTLEPFSDPMSDQTETTGERHDRLPGSTPEPRVISQSRLNSRNSPASNQQPPFLNHHLPATNSYSSPPNPFLPDAIRPSIEKLPLIANLHTSPRSPHSIPSTYDSDDSFKRESSLVSVSQLSLPPKHTVGVASTEQMPLDSTFLSASQKDEQRQQPSGPQYSEADLTRIIEQRFIIKSAIEHGVAEAIRHHQYVDAYALRLAYDHNQHDARFLLQTEAVAKQLITKEAAGEWALKIQPYKAEGARGHTALEYFVPEAKTDKSIIETHKPQRAPYAHLVSIDLSEVRNPKRKRAQLLVAMASEIQVDNRDDQKQVTVQQQQQQQQQPGSNYYSSRTEAEPEEAEPEEAEPDEAEAEAERVATPPRKRQKIQHDSSATRKAAASTTCTMDTHGTAAVVSPLKRRNHAGSDASDASSVLSSVPSDIWEDSDAEELEEAAEAAQSSKDGNALQAALQQSAQNKGAKSSVQMQHGRNNQHNVDSPVGAGSPADARAEVGGGTSPATVPAGPAGPAVPAPPAAASALAAQTRPINDDGPRRLPARRARGTVNPEGYYPRDPFSNSHSSHSTPPPPLTATSSSHPPATTTTGDTTSDSPLDLMSIDQKVSRTSFISETAASSSHFRLVTKKSKRGMPDFTPQYRLDDDDSGDRLRADARARTHALTTGVRTKSFVRGEEVSALSPPERPASPASSALSSVPDVDVSDVLEGKFETDIDAVFTAQKGRPSHASARSTRAVKRSFDEIEDDATPFSQDFGVEAGPGTGTGSRAATPRPAKRQKGTRRVKQSPMKNKFGPSLGAAALAQGGKRASPGVNGAPNNQEENDDFCSFCGGNGNLVCCDGCNKAFHYMDHTPVVDPNEDAAWFCWDCMVKRDPSLVGEHKGPFGSLMTNLDKKHAKVFALPKKIRDYFEGVRTGVDGEYEEFVSPVKGKKKEKNDEKEFDYYQIADKDDNPVLCHACARPSEDKRTIIPCSICGLWWHADCLDPPKAHPPNHRNFVCPCHVDQLLLQVPSQLGPAHKFRKVKGSSDIPYAYRRGNVNNGYIEIEDDQDDDAFSSAGPIGLIDPSSWGRLYRLQATGVRDDFISKLGGGNRPRKTAPRPKQSVHANVTPQSREAHQAEIPSFDYAEDAEERYEAALSIMSFSRAPCHGHDTSPATTIPLAAPEEMKADSALSISNTQVETASISELSDLEKKLKQMQDLIKAERAKRRGDDMVKAGLTNRPKKSRYSTRSKEASESTSSQQSKPATVESQPCKVAEDDQPQQDDVRTAITLGSPTIIAAPLDHVEDASFARDRSPIRDTLPVANGISTDQGHESPETDTKASITVQESPDEIDFITASVVGEIIDHAVDAANANQHR
ncbi:hypothetical protein BD289DRAFT_166311 [Coniella lustricola]|uniref:Zinc finger PHD-type domain-containing protein n=1 Tax=Coniella lustricola TaxID=2025994 RepID=A0A2T3AE51_9PEZI|nr:hypothetical protein BD289DRAFT_166311 [Coniella lustricola]